MTVEQPAIAVIIGRAGSKGLPGKNRLDFNGEPIISLTVRAAQAAQTIDHIVVSTDDDVIKSDVRASLDVAVVDRPPEFATDTSTVDAAVRHAVETIDTDHKIIVILYANVPLRPDNLIDRAVQTLIDTGADSVQSYSPVGKHHPYWMVELDDDGRVLPHHPNAVYRRQDLPPLLLPNGGVIAVTRESLFTVVEGEPHAFLGADRRGIITEPEEVVDIDTELDLKIGEAIAMLRRQKVSG